MKNITTVLLTLLVFTLITICVFIVSKLMPKNKVSNIVKNEIPTLPTLWVKDTPYLETITGKDTTWTKYPGHTTTIIGSEVSKQERQSYNNGDGTGTNYIGNNSKSATSAACNSNFYGSKDIYALDKRRHTTFIGTNDIELIPNSNPPHWRLKSKADSSKK